MSEHPVTWQEIAEAIGEMVPKRVGFRAGHAFWPVTSGHSWRNGLKLQNTLYHIRYSTEDPTSYPTCHMFHITHRLTFIIWKDHASEINSGFEQTHFTRPPISTSCLPSKSASFDRISASKRADVRFDSCSEWVQKWDQKADFFP